MERIACLVVGYLFGSFLTAEIVARMMAGTSIFNLGDGNPGMANVGHELGSRAGIICLIGDILKAALAILVAHLLYPDLGVIATAWAGLGATLGHIFPFWHRFRGGKGVTTISTAVILMSPLWGCLAGVVGVVSIVLSGYLSIAALCAMGFYTIAAYFTMPLDCALVSLVFMILQVTSHWSKLMGIRSGTTHRASLSTKFWAKVRGNK